MNGVADRIQAHLNVVQKFVQTAADDFAHLQIVQFGAQSSEMLLGGIAETSVSECRIWRVMMLSAETTQ